MDLRRKTQRWASVICCTVLLLSAVQVPARRDAAAAQPATSEQSGQRLAYIGSDHNLWLMSADGSGRTALTQDGLVSRFAWTPDGHSLAVVRRLNSATDPERKTDVALLSLASSTETLLLADLAAGIWSVAWTHDGTRLALLTYNWPDGTARVLQVDTETGDMAILDSWQPVGMGVGFPFITSGVAWSPDGRSLLVYGYPSRTEVLTVDGGAVTDKVFLAGSNSTGSLQEARCLCPRWSPDGSLIACHDFDRILVVTPDGNLVREFPVSERGWQSPAWSPDGIKIATGGRDGLWAIDPQSGERTHLVTREAWEPSWSPDGQYLAFSLVEGLGGEYHELQGIGVIGADGQGLQVYDVGSYLALWQPVQAPLEPVCGSWYGSVSDERIALTQVSESAGDECRGAFTFSNETEWWGDWGAYTLELEVRRTDNANAAWVTLLAPAESTESTYLLPSLDRELHTSPIDIYSAAQVSVSGEMTLASITVDLALQALGTAIDLIPGGSCLIPEEQLAYAAASFAYILAPAARSIWERDLDGALEELRQLLPQFLERCGDALKEVAGDCVSAGLTKLLGNPFVVGKLAVECIVWSAKAIYDYFDYQGRPVYATLVYEVPVIAEQFGPGRIVFVSHRDDNYGELYVMDGDGQNQKRLTNTPGVTEWHPAWSPDGARIVFQCELAGAASFDVCLINPDGSGYTRITDWKQDGSGAQRPVWSPDGSQIAVSREMRDGPAWIWLMNADGSNQRQLIEGRDPSWSPDGTRIAFEGQVNGGYPQLFTVNADGSDLRQLTELPDFVMYPTWSPDGRQIAFEVGMTYVAVIDTDGGPVRTIVDKRSWNLSWSSDGTQLAIAPMREGVLSSGVEWQAADGIWVVNLDGSGLHQIAQEGTQPSWHR